jgi:hypothetical protein
MWDAIISAVSNSAAPLRVRSSLKVPLIVPSALAPLSPMM